MFIRTKILATLGPASSTPDRIARLVEAGCDLFRINFSHGTREEHGRTLALVRAVEKESKVPIGVLADLCGPKIRVGEISGGKVLLEAGKRIVIQRAPLDGTASRISTIVPEIVDFARVGEVILLDDGKLKLRVVRSAAPDHVECEILVGGPLGSHKGINLPETDLPVPALTDKDRDDVAFIAGLDFDFVALSFVRSPDDVTGLRDLLSEHGCDAHIIAKIEKPQAIVRIEDIMRVVDGVMVARGDLGVEMDLPAVPVAQKRIARLAQAQGKSCIVATQMLETMTTSPVPTRAEVSDVANAVLDHTDAVMLSGETAVGEYPVLTVSTMNSILQSVQAYHDEILIPTRVTWTRARTEAALGAAVLSIVSDLDVAAVAVYTSSGTTARILSRHRLPCPIMGLSQNMAAVRRMCLYYGVEPVLCGVPHSTRDVLIAASSYAVEHGLARSGDKIVVVTGRPIGQSGHANTLVIHEIPGDFRDASPSYYDPPTTG